MSVINGCLELFDDGEGIDLIELCKNSILINNLNKICDYEIRTRTNLGFHSEKLVSDGSISKTEPDRVYRNVFIIKDFYRNNSLKTNISLEGLKHFESALKAVIVENCQVNWDYSCAESKSDWSIKMKTKLVRGIALYKCEIIFENINEGIIAKGRLKSSGHVINLIKGLPVFDFNDPDTRLKNVYYINKTGDNIPNNSKRATKENITKYKLNAKCCRNKEIQSNGIGCFKGVRESFDALKPIHKQQISGESRNFIKDLIVIGQFDKKAIMAKRKGADGSEEIWIFDQHACAERINLEWLMKTKTKQLSRQDMNMKACRAAVKFGDFLELSEQAEIIKNLQECNEPFHCAHGRPTCWLLVKIKKQQK